MLIRKGDIVINSKILVVTKAPVAVELMLSNGALITLQFKSKENARTAFDQILKAIPEDNIEGSDVRLELKDELKLEVKDGGKK